MSDAMGDGAEEAASVPQIGAVRRGSSLSVKLILRTTLLIVVTVVGSGVLNIFNIRRVFDDATERQQELFSRGREALGEFGTPLFGRAIQQLLVDRGRDADILSVVKETVAQDTKDQEGRKDYGLKLAFVLDLRQGVVVHCFEEAKLECVQGGSQPLGPALGVLTTKVWGEALEAWKKSAASNGPAIVKFDLSHEGALYRVFASPLYINAEPSAAGAIAAEPPDGRIGYVVLGYDLAPIAWFAQSAEKQKDEASTRAALYTGAVGALFALIGTVLAILQGLSITRPLKQLAWRADQIARGDLETRVDVSSTDEIGFLGENFNFMADQIAILLQQTAEKARIEQELEVARAIQETLVPTSEPVDVGPLKFAGYYQPAAQTGGDWWTWSQVGEGRYLLVIGDVTGHGVPSAMITAAAKAACDVARHIDGPSMTVSRLLEIMNHAIYESAQRRFVMTCFASIVDTKARTITYANAGHNFPYLFRANEGKGEFGSLMIRGNRLGDDRTSRYEAKTTDLVPGDVIIWYTDGIVECENEAGEEYGEKRFRASVRKAAALDAGEMRDAIVGDATTFFSEAPRKDDITMIVGRIH
ncbi:MAG: SpoIIE family protein phosphatase [Myxococcota bacterium]|nr:SpoIIE family protein phosphatase [Myxococcota bacterium]